MIQAHRRVSVKEGGSVGALAEPFPSTRGHSSGLFAIGLVVFKQELRSGQSPGIGCRA